MAAPQIEPYNPAWPVAAHRVMGVIESALPPTPSTRLEHVGSTSVPGLAAKPIIDLQLLVPALPSEREFEEALAPLGIALVAGARPDSPGVVSDTPRPGTDRDIRLHRKRLLHRPATDDCPEIILHIRRSDSPFAAFVIAFRDWLRADSTHAARYEAVKRALAERHSGASDYDDYTRAKSAFLDEVQAEMAWP